MPKPPTQPAISVCLEGFSTVVDGETVALTKGDLLASDNPIVLARPQYFGPVLLRYPVIPPEGNVKGTATVLTVEQATAAPGEKRGG